VADEKAWSDSEFARRLADVLIRRLFAVGLDLHGALAHIEPGSVAAHKVRSAVRGLDIAIKDFRGMFFDVRRAGAPSDGVRMLVVEAVERACGGCTPTITFGYGVDAVSERATSQRVAQSIHEILMRVPHERLSGSRVEVLADSRPRPRLVAHIDVPGGDVADVAGGAEATGVDVSWHSLSPAGSRIRVECPPAR
jgi:tartrate dehydratase alpha subunit/fumarate hydratase class I-like protein